MEKKTSGPAKSPGAIQDMEVQQRLEKLKGDYSRLNEQRIATDRDAKNLEAQLEALRQKAEQDYGTSELAALRQLLAERRQANARMVEEYEAHIAQIKARLAAIEAEEKGGA